MAEQKWAVEERKLSQALDDFGDGRYKPAQNAIDKHLKKHPKSQPALALRMALLERTGRPLEEVLQAFEKVKGTGELTSRSIWLATSSFRNLRRSDLSLKLYSDLWDANPGRTELGEQVFLCAASIWDTGVMCSSSRKMFNQQKTPVWARVAAWSEWVTKAPQPTEKSYVPPPAPEKALQIAKLLLNTSGPSTGLTPDSYWLKVQILISAGDLTDALKVAQEGGKEGTLSRLWTRMEVVPTILKRMGGEQVDAWTEEWSWVSEQIKEDKESQRNYAFYRYLLKAVSQLKEKEGETIAILKTLEAAIGGKERAPLLALLEFDNAVSESNKVSDADWEKAVERYWSRWGSKGSIVTELEGVAPEGRKRDVLSRKLEDRSAGSHSDLQAYREIVNARTYLLRQRPATWVPGDDDVESLWDLYLSGLAYGRNLPTTDIQPADDVGLAAVHLLIIQWSANKTDERSLCKALACLRYISSKSPSSAHAKYLYNRVARVLGATSLIPETYFTTAGPTEIQFDTLLHNTVDRASGEIHNGSMDSRWSAQSAKSGKVYSRTANDLPEYLKQALQNEAYSKIHEFRSVQQTLENSLSRAVGLIELARTQLIAGQAVEQSSLDEIRAFVKKAEDGTLVDTRDWCLFPDMGGNLPRLQDLLELGGELEPTWVSQWGRLIHTICDYCESVNVDSLTLSENDTTGLLPAEKAVWDGFAAYFAWSKNVVNGTEDAGPCTDLFSDLLAIVSNDKSSTRWLRSYSIFLLLEATKSVDVIYKRLQIAAQAKPATKGKGKQQVETHLTERISKTKPLRDGLNVKMKEISESLEELISADKEVVWAEVGKGFFEDEQYMGTIGKEVSEARSKAVRNVQNLLQGKKI